MADTPGESRPEKSDGWFVYILECGDGSLYTGATTDPERRLAEHKRGRGAKYTAARLPLRLVYVEKQPDRSAALRREWAIKQMRRKEKLALIREGKSLESDGADD